MDQVSEQGEREGTGAEARSAEKPEPTLSRGVEARSAEIPPRHLGDLGIVHTAEGIVDFAAIGSATLKKIMRRVQSYALGLAIKGSRLNVEAV